MSAGSKDEAAGNLREARTQFFNAFGAAQNDSSQSAGRQLAESSLRLGQIHQALGEYQQAEDRYRGLLPRLAENIENLPISEAALHRKLAEIYTLLAKYPLAVEHCGHALQRERSGSADYADALLQRAEVRRGQGAYREAGEDISEALRILEGVLGPEHARVANALQASAALHLAMGDYPKARALFEQALAMRHQRPGVPDLDLAAGLLGLAELYRAQGDWDQAQKSLDECLAIRGQALGQDHPALASPLLLQAELLRERRRFPEAAGIYERVRKIQYRAFQDSEHPDAARTLSYLGQLHAMQEDYPRAQEELDRALQIRTKRLGAEHPDTASSWEALGALHRAAGRHADAEKAYRRALEFRQKTLGPAHPDVARSQSHLANLYVERHRYPEARSAYEAARKVLEGALGPDSLPVAEVVQNLGAVFDSEGQQYEKARRAYEDSLAIRRKLLPAEDPVTIRLERSLGDLHFKYSQWELADAVYRGILEKLRRRPGAEADYDQVLYALAETAAKRLQWNESEDFHRRRLDERRRRLGDGHLEAGLAWSDLAEVLRASNKPREALDAYQQSLEILTRSRQDELHLAAIHCGMGSAALSAGRGEEALQYFDRCHAARAVRLNREDPLVAEAVLGRAQVLTASRRFREAEPLYEGLVASQERRGEQEDATPAWMALATVKSKLGKAGEAEPLLRKARALLASRQPESSRLASVLSALGVTLAMQTRFREADQCFQDARSMLAKVDRIDTPSLVPVLKGMAEMERSRGRYERAREELGEALKLQEKIPPPGADPLDLAATQNDLALVLTLLGKYSEAEKLYLKSLDALERSQDAPRVAVSRGNLGDLYREMRKPIAAQYLEGALRVLQQSGEAWQAELADTREKLARVEIDRGNFQRAEELYQQARQFYERSAGAQGRETARLLGALASLYHKKGDRRLAEDFYNRVDRGRYAETFDLVLVLEDYARFLREQRQVARASIVRERADSLRTRLGADARK